MTVMMITIMIILTKNDDVDDHGDLDDGDDNDDDHLAHARRSQGEERGSSVSTQNVRSRSFFAWGHNCWNSDGDGGRCYFIVDICDRVTQLP